MTVEIGCGNWYCRNTSDVEAFRLVRANTGSHLVALPLCHPCADAVEKVDEVEALRSVVRRLCVRALDDSPLGPVVDTTEARWFNPTPAEMAAVRRALESDQ